MQKTPEEQIRKLKRENALLKKENDQLHIRNTFLESRVGSLIKENEWLSKRAKTFEIKLQNNNEQQS